MIDPVRHYESHVRIHLVNSLRQNGLRALPVTDRLRGKESFRFMSHAVLSFLAISVLAFPAINAVGAQTPSGTTPKPRGKAAKSTKKPKAAPAVSTFESRRADWIRRKEAAASSGTTGPDPLEQYLVSEVLVTGLFETDSGFGVFLLATPTGNTFFATNGARLFNGRLVTIERTAGGFADDAQIVFEERGAKGAPQRVVKRVVAVPTKVEEPETPPPTEAEPPDAKPKKEKPPLATH